jgi:hypothetical protein
MGSYYRIGTGYRDFLKKTSEVRATVKSGFRIKCCLAHVRDPLCYAYLIDHVQARSEKLFEHHPTLWFRIRILEQKLTIEIPVPQKTPITLLRIHLLECGKNADRHYNESMRMMERAFSDAFQIKK